MILITKIYYSKCQYIFDLSGTILRVAVLMENILQNSQSGRGNARWNSSWSLSQQRILWRNRGWCGNRTSGHLEASAFWRSDRCSSRHRTFQSSGREHRCRWSEGVQHRSPHHAHRVRFPTCRSPYPGTPYPLWLLWGRQGRLADRLQALTRLV